MGNLLVAQSGGPTAAINATLAGVLMEAMLSEEVETVYGGRNGIKGVLEARFVNLYDIIQNTNDLERLSRTPSALLGSCRFKLSDGNELEEQCEQIISIFRKYHIRWFVYIGGNDSMDTVAKLSVYCIKNKIDDIYIAGAPKTIDNDLMGIDHCPGYSSAAKYIATTFSEIERDIAVYDSFGVTIVEVMGRNTGWLTAASALAKTNGGRGPDYIYLCEVPFDQESFCHDIQSKSKENRNLLIAVSEGLKDETGRYLSEEIAGNQADVFGHSDISGTGKVLAQLVREHFGCKVRSIELNLMQRCAGHLACTNDLNESRLLGAKAVKTVLYGRSGEMVSLNRREKREYVISFTQVPIADVANRERAFPIEWIAPEHNHVKQEFTEYLAPLLDETSNAYIII